MASLLSRWRLALAMASDPRLKTRVDIATGLHLLELFNDGEGRAWPSYETIAARVGAHRATAFRSVQRLIRFGYFELTAGGGRGRSNSYRLRVETVAPLLLNEPETVAPLQLFPEPETVAPLHRNSSRAAQKPSHPCDATPLKTPLKTPSMDVVDVASTMLTIWRDELGEVLAVPRKLTDSRKRAAAKRLKEEYGGDLEAWREFCRLIRSKPVRLGAGERGWRADFDWALKPDSRTKTEEGKYDERQALPERNAPMREFDNTGKEIEKNGQRPRTGSAGRRSPHGALYDAAVEEVDLDGN